MFFDENRTPVIPASSDGHFVMARKLAHVLSKKRLTQRQPNIQQWASHFQSLISQHGEETVSKILDYYIGTIGKEYSFQAYSGKSFREKFPRIKERYDRDTVINRPVSKNVREILKRIDHNYAWPSGAELELSSFVQRCHDNYAAFYAQLQAFRPKEYSNEWRLHRFLMESRYCSPIEFTLIWIEYVQDILETWDEWQGTLNPFVWNLSNAIPVRKECGAAFEFGMRAEGWKRYINQVTGS